MSRCISLTIAVGCVVLLLFPTGAARATPLPIDDFNDGNDDGWLHENNTEGTWDVISQEYVLASVGPTEGALGSLWENSDNDPQFNHGFLQGQIRVNTVNTNDTFAWLAMRAQPFSRGYLFGPGSSGDSFVIWEVNPNDPNPIEQVLDNPSIPTNIGDDWILEGGVVGNQLSLKVWRPGESVPAKPQWTIVDPTPPAIARARGIMVGLNKAPSTDQPGEISATFDDIFFTPIVPGDANGDGAVNFEDLTPFATALTDVEGYTAAYPALGRDYVCDVSGDGLCNFGDLAPFVALLNPQASSSAIPEPATWALATLLTLQLVLMRFRTIRT